VQTFLLKIVSPPTFATILGYQCGKPG